MTRRGVPATAILASSVIGFLCVIAAAVSPDTIFAFLLNSSGAIILFVYLLIAISQIVLRYRTPDSELRVKMWLFPVLVHPHRAWRSWPSWCRWACRTDIRSQLVLSLLSWAVVLVLYVANKWFVNRPARTDDRARSPGEKPHRVLVLANETVDSEGTARRAAPHRGGHGTHEVSRGGAGQPDRDRGGGHPRSTRRHRGHAGSCGSPPDQIGETLQIERFSLELIDPRRGSQRTILARDHWTGDAKESTVSPDGRSLVYMRWNSFKTRPANGRALFSVRMDGTHNRRLTPWKLGAGDHPAFSPNGRDVFFHSFAEEDDKQPDYYTVDVRTRRLTRLSHAEDGTLVLSASYSSDGGWIVHATNGVDDQADIFVMRADGTGDMPVTRTKAWDSAPDWGPPGS